MNWRIAVAAALASLFLVGSAAADCTRDTVVMRGDWGQARFTVELADTPEERAQGLMHRESLPQGAGMLFIYDAPQRVSFWMRNTLIPLDMIFIGPDGVVRRVHDNAQPGDADLGRPWDPVGSGGQRRSCGDVRYRGWHGGAPSSLWTRRGMALPVILNLSKPRAGR
jgi:uncharacterized membrane protein (UPF0127 family)